MWAEAAITTPYNVNIVSNSTTAMKVPYAIWHRKMPVYSKLRGFGCAVLAYIDKFERRKVDAKARKDVLVGNFRDNKGYRLLDNKAGKRFYSHTAVSFDEKPGRLPQRKLSSPSPTASHAPTTLGVDKRKTQKLPSLMDTLSDPNGSRPGGAASETDDDRTGEAISMKRGARSGGAKKCQEHGPYREPHRPQTNSAHTERGRASCGALRRLMLSESEVEPTTSKKGKRGLVELQPHGDAEVSRANGDSNESSLPERTVKEASTVVHLVFGGVDHIKSASITNVWENYDGGDSLYPPHWFGDLIHLAYIATNPERHNQLASTEWEKAREELQYAMVKAKALDWWDDYCCLAGGAMVEPHTMDEAIYGENSEQWKKAADAEYDALVLNNTLELVPRKKGKSLIIDGFSASNILPMVTWSDIRLDL
ncbi:unnamed protein product [Phytophthora fragariaefolia]|uniref:Unnamed protein product n=1 Tax=Phytophthora fragariaefolia TaxID=1490495 RepID=A0A9W6Y1Q8_9STRA|nr:unnamed protein product [Phytophthora fragariaefolia]